MITDEIKRKSNIKKLENLSDEVLKLKQELGLRRPILIEFCGSPKAGKTSSINALNIFLKRNDFRTVVLTERASVCPIDNKMHPSFNIWTACSAVVEIVKNLYQGKDQVDVIIADRAIFDALCWFDWLNNNPLRENPSLGDNDHKALQTFLNMNLLVKSIDLIYIFKTDPKVSLQREYANLLTDKRGSIMNESILESYNEAIDRVQKKNKKVFKRIEVIETNNKTQNEVSFQVTSTILEILRDMLIEKVGYLKLVTDQVVTSGFPAVEKWKLFFDNRDKVEGGNYIQPIPIAVITNHERTKVLTLKKNKSRLDSDSPEKDKILIYAGGHIRIEDKSEKGFVDTVKNALNRELQEELNESVTINNFEPLVIYTPQQKRSAKHVALCFVVTMNLDEKKFNPTPLEFIQKTGKSISGQILTINNLLSYKGELDTWSKEIFKKIFNKEREYALFDD